MFVYLYDKLVMLHSGPLDFLGTKQLIIIPTII